MRKGANEVRDVQNIADILVDPEGARERRDHWEKTAHALLTGAILHVLYAEDEKTLARVATFLADPVALDPAHAQDHADHQPPRHRGRADGASGRRLGRARAPQQVRQRALGRGVDRHELPRALPRSASIAANTARSDWRIADLMAAERPVSLYLVVPPSDISRTRPLVRLILNQIAPAADRDAATAATATPDAASCC